MENGTQADDLGAGQKSGAVPEGDPAASSEGRTALEVGGEGRTDPEVGREAEPLWTPQTQEAESLGIQ